MAIQRIETEAAGVRWRLRLYLGRDPETGKRLIHTETFDRKGDAEERRDELKGSGPAGGRVKPSKQTLRAYLAHWLDNVKAGTVRARTLHDYRGMLDRYVMDAPIGRVRMDRLQAGAFEGLYTRLWREKGLSPRTLQYLHAVLRQALTHAVATRVLTHNPTDNVTPKTQDPDGVAPEKAMRAMTREEAAHFLATAADDEQAALWTVLLMTGIRPGEAFALKWEDVNLEEGKIHVRRSLTRRGVKGWRLTEPKTKRARRAVALPDVATRALRRHRTEQSARRLKLGSEWEDNGFVFTATFGTPLDLANIYRRFKALLERAELGTWSEPNEDGDRTFAPGFRLYDLRHSHATHLLLAGENVKIVSERLGHANVTLTMDTYQHVLPDMQEASAAKLDAMFGTG